MSEQNGQNTTTTETEKRDELPMVLFATREEALAAIPANPPKNTRPFEITQNDTVLGWILAIGYDPAISRAAQLAGYKASTGPRRAAVVTKETVASRLAQFTDEELAELGLTRKPVKTPRNK